MLFQRLRELKLWKKRSIRWISPVFVLLALFCVVRIIVPCREYRFEGGKSFDGVAAGQVTVYEGISLPPGVYQVELEYSSGTDMQSLCNVADGTVFSGGLLSNGELLYSGLDKTGYRFWLYESTDGLQVQIAYDGAGSLTTGNLRIVETNQLWTMLLALLLFAAAAVYAALIFSYYDRCFPVSAEKKKSFFFVMLIGLIASLPYLCGYNIVGADLVYHMHRIEGVKDGLLSGQFPVRLEPEWLFGHGYADAIFYCGSLLYFPALLRLLGFTVTASYNIYCIALNFATAWISFHCFRKIFGSWWNGVICSALYTLSVFRSYKLLGTSAVGEGSAVTFVPLVIFGVYRIFTEDTEEAGYKTAWVPVMLGLTGLLQTHVLTCEITVLVMLLFFLLHFRKVFRKKTLLQLLKGAVSAVAVSLWFLAPFADYYLTQDIHIKHVSTRTIQDRGLYPAHLAYHFWGVGRNTPTGDNGMQYSHPLGIGLVLIVGLGVFLILWFSGRLRDKDAERLSFAKKTEVISALLLLMSMNIFPWDRIQSMNPVFAALVSSLQFPNRFLGWGTVCLVFLFGYCLCYLSDRRDKRWLAVMLTVAVTGIATSDMYLLEHNTAERSCYILYNEESMGAGHVSGGEYLPEGTDDGLLTYTGPKAGTGVEIFGYEKDYLHVDLQCGNDEGNDSYVEVPLLYYKGYVALEADSGSRLEVCAGENNVVRVLLPAGFEGGLEVKFIPPFYWRASELVSGAAAVLLIVLWFRALKKRTGGYKHV